MNEALPAAGGEFRLPDPDAPSLAELLRYADAAEVDSIIAHRARELAAEGSPLLLDYFYVDALLTAVRMVRDSQGDPREILPEAYREPQSRELLPLCRELMRRAVAYRDSRGSVRCSGVIRKARSFIDARFTDPKLTLGDVAAHVALSNNHFCTIFSREMGVTFTEYLTGLRIRRAEELLRGTPMRTGEVAYAVGYNDPHYFSLLFKRRTGLSPRDYRRSCMGAPQGLWGIE